MDNKSLQGIAAYPITLNFLATIIVPLYIIGCKPKSPFYSFKNHAKIGIFILQVNQDN